MNSINLQLAVCALALPLLGFAPFAQINAQSVIELYERDKIPDAIPSPDKSRKYTGDDGIVREEKISIPTITAFIPDRPTGESVIICPGGGYSILATAHEGDTVARRLNESGIAAFILRYRLPDKKTSTRPHLAPVQDLQRAIDLVRTRAGEWRIDPAKIGVMGFSAGGHLAAIGGTHFDRRHVESKSGSLRPDFVILAYPVVTSDPTFTHSGSIRALLGGTPSSELLEEFSAEKQVTNNTPPCFLVHSANDDGVPVKNSFVFAEALSRHKIPFELHVFPKGGHGYGTNNKTTKTDWFVLCVEWIKSL